jgi:hypothetical protein
MEIEPELLRPRDCIAGGMCVADLVLPVARCSGCGWFGHEGEDLMHLSGIGQTVYGPQLPCCPNAAAATAGVLESGVPCDPNCLEGDKQAAVIERMQSAIDALTASTYDDTDPSERARPVTWLPGIENSTVALIGIGLGAILLLGRRR